MRVKRITPSLIRRLQYQDELSEAGGLRVRKLKDDRASFLFSGRVAGTGKNISTKLGKFPDISISQARKLAGETRADVGLGVDVTEERKAKRERERKTRITLNDVLEEYVRIKKNAPKTIRDKYYTFKVVSPGWRDRPLRGINREMIRLKFLEQSDAGNEAQAAKWLRYLSSVFTYAIDADLIDLVKNPAKLKNIDPALKRPLISDEYLTPVQACQVIRFINDKLHKMDSQNREMETSPWAAIELILFTGLRSSDVLKIKWNDTHLRTNSGDWFAAFPSKDVSRHKVWGVPITIYTKQIFERQDGIREQFEREEGAPCPYVFPSRKKLGGPIKDLKRSYQEIIKKLGFKVNNKILRHTMANAAQEIQLPRERIDELTFHHRGKSRGLATDVYLHNDANNLRDDFQAVQKAMIEASSSRQWNWNQFLEDVEDGISFDWPDREDMPDWVNERLDRLHAAEFRDG